MIEKMERLKSEGVDKIHVGICINQKCPHYNSIMNMLDKYKIEYELGTH
jgi:predicted metal-binding protein